MNNEDNKQWRAAWLRGGSISEVTWIGHDILAWCSGLFITFFDVTTNKLRLPKFPNDVIEAGASCISGHLSQKIFAFAEKNRNPKISIYTYPSLSKLSSCEEGTSYAYLTTTFAGDYLLSLGSIPDFELIVWSWRTGHKIASIDTHIHDADDFGQKLKVNFTLPIFAAQIGNTTGKLAIWEIKFCSISSILTEHKIILPNKALVQDVSWCFENPDTLAIVDRDGHIYLTDSIGENLTRIIQSQRCGVCIEIEPALICWHRNGLVLRTTFCQTRYFRKDSKNFWRKIWFTKNTTYPILLISHPYHDDRLFFISREGYIMQIRFFEEPFNGIIEEKRFIGGSYRLVDLVGDCVAAIDASKELSVIEVYQGSEISKLNLELEGNVTSMLSHPDYPLIVVSSDTGIVAFVSLIDCYSPIIIWKYRMHKESLDFMKFSNTGRYLAVCQNEHGICFIFHVSPEYSIDVITRLDISHKIVDILLFEVQNNLRFYALRQSSNVGTIGYKLLLYELPLHDSDIKTPSNIFYFKEFYQSLHYLPGDIETFAGVPYPKKQIRFFKINDSKDFICYNVIHSGHDVRRVTLFSGKKWLISSGLDGSIIVRNINTKNNKKIYFLTHHRCDFGVRKAFMNSNGDALVTLGTDGSIVCLRHFHPDINDDKFRNLYEYGETKSDYNMNDYSKTIDDKILKFLSRSNSPSTEFEKSDIPTWVEWKEQQKIEEERKMYAEGKMEFLSLFNILKSKVIDLLNSNETCTELEKVSMSSFALDMNYREKRMKSAKDEREEVRRKSEHDCLEMDGISDWLIENFWNYQKVLGQSIYGIFNNLEVTNYTICENNSLSEDYFQYAQFTRDIIWELTNKDITYPWQIYTPEELSTKFDRQSEVKKIDETEEIARLMDIEEEQLTDPEEERNRYIFEGMTTRNFIKPTGSYHPQFKIYAFSQILCDNRSIVEDCKKLRLYFNKHFDDMYMIKEREMNLVRERIDRIVYITFELEVMFNEFLEGTLTYPEWKLKERPEDIIDVMDSEMTTKPYISPSEQDLLDKQAAEEEQVRLALLADDFRDRALVVMMDGVLEVRWEDLLRKEPQKPDCMLLEKKDEDYTDEEILVVKRYQLELQHLESERERYRKILLSDYSKINDALSESIEKFNSRLEEFHLLKMKIEAAIQQLNLRYVRYYVRHVDRVSAYREDTEIKDKINEKYQLVANLSEEMKIIHEAEHELHRDFDSLTSKDKLMDKKMKSDFLTLGKNAFAVINSHYKKRPRIVLKTTSQFEILDLGKSIKSMEKLSYLTPECLDYLKQLEIMDIRPSSLPQSIESTHWENLIVLRRLKIDHELKEYAVHLELEEASRILLNYSRKLNDERIIIETLKDKLKKLRAERLESELNAELQLVLKLGQTEIDTLNGSENAVAIPMQDLHYVNNAVRNAGKQKLEVMEKSLLFRKGMEVEKWEHKCLKMHLSHLGEEMYFIRMANVTREIREYLRRMKKGLKDDKTAMKMNRDFEATRKGQQKILNDWETKLDVVTKEILRLRKKNETLDDKVLKMNIDRCDMEMNRDVKGEMKEKHLRDKVHKIHVERSAVVRKLLKDYEELLKLREERENLLYRGCKPVNFSPDCSSDDNS